jgi:hypothetical protein
MAGDLWSFRDDVGHDRADLTGMTVEAVDGSVGSVKDEIKGAPDFEAGTGTDPAYRDAIARHYGA